MENGGEKLLVLHIIERKEPEDDDLKMNPKKIRIIKKSNQHSKKIIIL